MLGRILTPGDSSILVFPHPASSCRLLICQSSLNCKVGLEKGGGVECVMGAGGFQTNDPFLNSSYNFLLFSFFQYTALLYQYVTCVPVYVCNLYYSGMYSGMYSNS